MNVVVEFPKPIKINNAPRREELVSHEKTRMLIDDCGNTLFIHSFGQGYKLELYHQNNDDDLQHITDMIAKDENDLNKLLDTYFIGYVTPDEYEEIYAVAKAACSDAGFMLKKRFSGIDDKIEEYMNEHLDEYFGILLDEDYIYCWLDYFDNIAPEDYEIWSDDYKEVVANFYGEAFYDVYDISCGVKTNRYSIMNRMEALGYKSDYNADKCVFTKGDEILRFDNYAKAEEWVEGMENELDL